MRTLILVTLVLTVSACGGPSPESIIKLSEACVKAGGQPKWRAGGAGATWIICEERGQK